MGRFVAIVIISLLGSGFYAGLRMSAPDMRLAADQFFDETALYDVSVACTLGLDDRSLDELRSIQGVEGLMATHKADAMALVGGDARAVAFETLPDAALESDTADGVSARSDQGDYLNRPILVEGRWPQDATECVLGIGGLQEDEEVLGGSVVLEKSDGDLADTFTQTEFTVVGLVNSSFYIATGTLGVTDLANGVIDLYAYVPDGAFAADLPYAAAYLTLEGAADHVWDTDSYEVAAAPVIERVDEAAAAIGAQREQDIREEAQGELDDARREFQQERDDAQAKLDDAKAQLDSAQRDLADAQAKLDDAKPTLDSSKATLDESKGTLDAQEAEYQKGLAALESQRKDVEAADAALPALEQQRAALAALPNPDAATLAALDAQIKAIRQGKADFQAAERELAEGRRQLDAGWKQYNEGLAAWEQGTADYEQGLRDYESGKAEYERGLAEYQANDAKAQQEFADAEAELADAQADIDALEPAEVFVMDRAKNPGAASLSHDAQSITQIATFLPFMFFLVAALVILTSMTRMVDEERMDIGTHKALGYGKARITSKYLIYGVLASGIGSVIGVLTLGKLLPWFIMTSYAVSYSVPIFDTPIDPVIAGKAIGLSLVVAVVAIWGACSATLREKPAALMLPKVPKAGKRILLERIGPLWRRMSFSQKVTARNLLRYKRRFFMAVVGIAGCTALLMIGFGLRDSIGGIVDNQYARLMTYDVAVQVDEDAPAEQLQQAQEALEGSEVAASLPVHSDTMIAESADGDLRLTLTVPQDAGRLQEFVNLREREGGTPITLEENQVVLTEKLARELGVGPGDEVTLYDQNAVGDKDGAGHRFTVGAIAENYLQHYAYLLPRTYQDATGHEPVFDRYLVNLADDAQGRAFVDAMVELEAVHTASLTSEEIDRYQEMLGVMDKLIVVIVLLSAALAFVVLYNLTNINISERIREIATLRVLGFTKREVDLYIFREILVMVLIGALVGCVIGVPLTFYIAQAAETAEMMFGRVIEPFSYVAAFLITIAFGFIVCMAMRPKLARVDMVESLKSVE